MREHRPALATAQEPGVCSTRSEAATELHGASDPTHSLAMAAKPERVLLDVAGREVSVSNPDKLYFPEAGITKLEVVRYYLGRGRGRVARRRRTPECAGPLRERDPRRVLLPEARARLASAVGRGGGAPVPVRARGRGGCAARRRGARLDREPGMPRAPPAPGPRRGPRPPGRAARGPECSGVQAAALASSACFFSRADLAWFTSASMAAISLTARSARTLRSRSIPAALRPSVNRL